MPDKQPVSLSELLKAADERDALRAEVERLKSAVTDLGVAHIMAHTEVQRLRARLCYVNPDGSHVRGCAQHEAMHPAQWCEALARANCG